MFQLSFGGPPATSRTHDAREEAERLIVAAGGSAVKALERLVDEEEQSKKEMGVVAFYAGGPMHAQSFNEEVLLQLRVAIATH